MAEITLKYISDEGLYNLKQSFGNNVPHYKSGNQEFFLDYLEQNNYLLESSYKVKDFTDDLQYTSDTDADDLHNIKVVYGALKSMPTYIMMDDRFWAGLTHTYMWQYVMKRRQGEAFGIDIQNQEDKIYNSFFTHTKNGIKRGTYVNCVSRLWWAGKMTYDEGEENHYALTEELCKKGFPSTIILVSSSNIMSRPEALKSLLATVKELRASGIDVKRDDIVAGIRYLNLVAGSTLIDMMSYPEVKSLIAEYYQKYYG